MFEECIVDIPYFKMDEIMKKKKKKLNNSICNFGSPDLFL